MLAISASLHAQNAGNHNPLFDMSDVHISGTDYVIIPPNANVTAERTSVTMKYRDNTTPSAGSTQLKWKSGDKIDVYESDSKLSMPKTWSAGTQGDKILELEAHPDATAGNTQTLQAEYTNTPLAASPTGELEFTLIKVEIENTRPSTPVVLSDDDIVHVAKLVKFRPKFPPDISLVSPSYQWEIDGSQPPQRDVAIKTYDYDVENVVEPTDLVAADLQPSGDSGDGEISFFYTKEKEPSSLKVTITSGSNTFVTEVDLKVEHVEDPNREIYAAEIPDADDNPNGSGGIVKINELHEDRHNPGGDKGLDPNTSIANSTYDGQDFLDWHERAINAHMSWRSLFHVTDTIAAKEYAFRDGYLTENGGSIPSPIYGYVRIGECKDANEAAQIGAEWHSLGHGDAAREFPDMDETITSMKSKDNTFWKWHQEVEKLRNGPFLDKAGVDLRVPDKGAVLATPPTTITVSFEKCVSLKANANTVVNFKANDAQITAGALTVNGQQATSVTTTNYRDFTFTLPSLNPGQTVNVVLTGTRGFDSDDWTFEIE